MEFERKNCLILLLLCITLNHVCSKISAADCILDIQFSTSLNNSSDCELHTWGGFINKSCCGFDDYLYALGLHANQSGKLFLNSSEQDDCLASMEVFQKNYTFCGVEKLTSGSGGCSDFSVMDVMNNLGDKLRRLDKDCIMPLRNNGGRTNETCSACLRRWEEINATPDSERESESANFDANVCRFAVLVSLINIRNYDRESMQAVYECLGTQSLSAGEVLLNQCKFCF